MDFRLIVEMLSLWNVPAMWVDSRIYFDVKTTIAKLSSEKFELTEDDVYLLTWLTKGLNKAVHSSFKKVPLDQQEDLKLKLKLIKSFEEFLISKNKMH